jgi:DNA-binding CsgD family transcriptional regulator/GAF domain-containing protein
MKGIAVRRATYGDTFAAADQVLRSVATVLSLAVPRLRFGESDPGQVADALDNVSSAVRAAADARPDLRGAASVATAELAAARLDVLAWETLRSREAAQRVTRVLRGFRCVDTVAELAGVIPAQAAGLGYDRVLLSWVERGRWIPCSACTQTDPAQATAMVAASKPPYRRTSDLLEDQVVRMRSTILVQDVLGNPRVHADLLAVTGSTSYVAAPLLLRGQVIGLIHADRNLETGTMDDFDRDLLALLAEGLGAALDRAQALTEAETIRRTVAGHAAAIQDLMGQLGQAHPGPAVGNVPIPRPGQLPGHPDPGDAWRDELTRREEQVLRLVAEGLTNAQIGERLFVAEGTVKSHLKNLMRKLGTATRAEAGAAYHRHLSPHCPGGTAPLPG